jgi:anti-sigma factor RsiW
MNGPNQHPSDFSAYLDRDYSDSRYAEISSHLPGCDWCRKEVGQWQSLDAMFRSGDLEPVPQGQWLRIAARMQSPRRKPLLARFRLLFDIRRPAWGVALSALVLGAAIWAGLTGYRNYEKRQLLSIISRYASEEANHGPEENLFRIATSMDQSHESNPFAVRR